MRIRPGRHAASVISTIVSARFNRRTPVVVGASATSVALFAFAFVAAPKSCEWGNEAYFWSGVACLVVLSGLPFALRAGESIVSRAGLGLALAALGCGVWLAGFFAADFRIMCRLF